MTRKKNRAKAMPKNQKQNKEKAGNKNTTVSHSSETSEKQTKAQSDRLTAGNVVEAPIDSESPDVTAERTGSKRKASSDDGQGQSKKARLQHEESSIGTTKALELPSKASRLPDSMTDLFNHILSMSEPLELI